MDYTWTVGDLVVGAGFMAYIFFYFLALIYFKSRSIRTRTVLTIFDITLSVVFAMTGSVIVFLVIAGGFVE